MRASYGRLLLLVGLPVVSLAVIYGVVASLLTSYSLEDEYGSVFEAYFAWDKLVVRYHPGYYDYREEWLSYIGYKKSVWSMGVRGVPSELVFHGAYVVPCRLLSLDEFVSLADRYGLWGKLVYVYLEVRHRGTGERLWNSLLMVDGGERGQVVSLVEDTVWEALRSLRGRLADPRFVEVLERFNATSSVPLSLDRDDIAVYVEAFGVRATVGELAWLSSAPEILLVDAPVEILGSLGLPWMPREVVVKRLVMGEPWLELSHAMCGAGPG